MYDDFKLKNPFDLHGLCKNVSALLWLFKVNISYTFSIYRSRLSYLDTCIFIDSLWIPGKWHAKVSDVKIVQYLPAVHARHHSVVTLWSGWLIITSPGCLFEVMAPTGYKGCDSESAAGRWKDVAPTPAGAGATSCQRPAPSGFACSVWYLCSGITAVQGQCNQHWSQCGSQIWLLRKTE